METSSGASNRSGSGGLIYASFGLDRYRHDFKDYLDTKHFGAVLSHGDAETVYDSCNGLDHDKALGAWVCH